jgi:TrmH family RNA methyltransferase
MELRIVIVEPEYQINLGYMARAAKNFGIRRLFIVNPKCRHIGKDAIKYSKHAHALLENAKVCGSIREATRGSSLVVGTTGLGFKASEGMFNICSPKRLPGLVSNAGRVSLLIGRDGTGLSKEELADCDANVVIPACEDYPILNISHALAILLYELYAESSKGKVAHEEPVRERELLIRLFAMGISGRKDIKDKKAVVRAFGHVIRRASPSGKEMKTLAAALSLNRNSNGR